MIGPAIREARLSKGLTQDQLAEAAAISRQHLSSFEKGGDVTVSVLQRIVRALDIDTLPLDSRPVKFAKGAGAIDALAAKRAVNDAIERLTVAKGALAAVEDQKRPGPKKGIRPTATRAASSNDDPEGPRPVRIYLVEDDQEHAGWSAQLKDFASRSDEVEYRIGVHTPAKYKVPIRGIAAAGHGAEIQPVDEEDKRQIPDHYWEEKGARDVLRIYGNSLKGRGIVDHDLVYIKPLNGGEPRQRSIVVAELDDKIVVKIWRKVKGRPLLFSAHPKFPDPIDPSKFSHFAVKGVVVGRSGYGLSEEDD